MPESKTRFPIGFALVLGVSAALCAVLVDSLTIKTGGGEG